jgi:G6PDH family F420-dependent oxidoreductase
MPSIGYFQSREQYGPKELVEQAKRAATAGFERLWISDHFHPNDEQGQSPFVWGVIGAPLSEATSLPMSTAVSCPTIRIHPAIQAQAAATAAVQLDGRFVFGVGSSGALNEHSLGDPWPSAGVRLKMLEEAVEVPGQRQDNDARTGTTPGPRRIRSCPDRSAGRRPRRCRRPDTSAPVPRVGRQ